MAHTSQGIMPGGDNVLDPILQKYMQQQRTQQFFGKLAQMGQGMIAASMRGADIGPAFAAGVGQASGGGRGGGGNDMLQMMRMQGVLDQRRQDQEAQRRAGGQHAAQEALGAGNRYDPQKGILWDQPPTPGREPPAMTGAQRQDMAAQAYPKAAAKAQAAEYFPDPTKYGGLETVMMGDKPTLVRLPQTGGAPQVVPGVEPYTKPGEGPAIVQTADAYRLANEKSGITVSQLDALKWARTSVSKSPSDVFMSIYSSLVRGFVDSEEAKNTATEMTKYIMDLRAGGGTSQPPLAPDQGSADPAEAAVPVNPANLLKQAQEFFSGGPIVVPNPKSKTAVTVPLPPEDGAPAPRRKPAREIDGPTRPIPLDASGKVEASRLEANQTYEAADGTRWRWNGQNFTEVL